MPGEREISECERLAFHLISHHNDAMAFSSSYQRNILQHEVDHSVLEASALPVTHTGCDALDFSLERLESVLENIERSLAHLKESTA